MKEDLDSLGRFEPGNRDEVSQTGRFEPWNRDELVSQTTDLVKWYEPPTLKKYLSQKTSVPNVLYGRILYGETLIKLGFR